MNQQNSNTIPSAAEIRRVLLESLDLNPDDGSLSDAASVHDIVALDSVAAVRFVVALEAAYGVTIEEDWLSLDRLTDLDSLAAYLRQRVSNPLASDSASPAQQQEGA